MRKFGKMLWIGLFALAGCAPSEAVKETVATESPVPTVSAEAQVVATEFADMSGYEKYDENRNYPFIEKTVDEVVEKADTKESSFVVYIGFETCPYCNQALNVLTDVANEKNQTIDYINLHGETLDLDSYNRLTEWLKDWLSYDDDGEPALYAPSVVFVGADGEIKNMIVSIDGYISSDGDLTEEQTENLYKTYEDAFELILNGSEE